MLVPDALLDPPDAHSRGLDPDAGLVLDEWLRRLASQEALARLALGTLARAFLRARGVQACGFARVRDWARERLGLSGREVQSLAWVATRLGDLPELRAAFIAGEVSWAQVRLLAKVATPDTQAEWIGRAAGRTVRALEAHVRADMERCQEDRAAGEAHAPRDDAGVAAGRSADDDTGAARARFHIRCPRRVARLWHETVALARRVAGAELSAADAAEAVAAEGLSDRAAAVQHWPTWEAPPAPPADPDEGPSAFAPALDWAPVREALPADVAALAEGAAHLDPFALDARLRAVIAALQAIDWQTGRLLRILVDRRIYLRMGFSSASRYLCERLGCSERKARALLAIERRSWWAPGLAEAYRGGRLSWTQALTLLPVAHEDTIAAWLARAGEVTVRRLAEEVEWALVRGRPFVPLAPPPLGAPLALEDEALQTCARPQDELIAAEIRFAGPADVIALFQTAVLAFREGGEPLWKALERLCHHVRATWTAGPRVRDPIFARDGWICAVPVCTARRNLQDHHVVFRSHGGSDELENRITLCAWHHLRGVHAGVVRASGKAPDAITWEIGVRAGRRPLLRVEGVRLAV